MRPTLWAPHQLHCDTPCGSLRTRTLSSLVCFGMFWLFWYVLVPWVECSTMFHWLATWTWRTMVKTITRLRHLRKKVNRPCFSSKMHASAFVFQPHILENLHGKPGKLHTLRRYAFFLLLSRRRSCCKVGQIWIGVERPGLQHCGHTAYFRLPSSRRDDSSSAGSRWHRACQTLTCSDIQRWQSWKWLHLAWRRLARTSTRICVAWWQAVLRHSRSRCCWVSDHNGLHAQDLGEGTWSYFLHLHSKRLPALRIEASAIAIMHRIASIASLRTNISIIARHWISLKRHVLRQQIALGSTTLGLWHLHLEWYLAIHQLWVPHDTTFWRAHFFELWLEF